MIRYTDTYHAARIAGARPIFLLYLGTDRAVRCFGKHTPTAAQVGPDALEWSGRVLTFGDLRQSLSSNSEKYLQGLFEEEISSYGAELDSADGYFQEIAGKETILNGVCQLLQGFDYPGFVYADFIPLFYGTISTFNIHNTRFKFTAKQNVKPDDPPSPTIDTTTVYAMSNAGTGFTGASGTFPYATTSPALYADDSWVFTAEIDLDDNTIDQSLFAVENSSQTRFDIGIDSNGDVYLAYNADVGSPSLQTLTSSVNLPTGKSRIEVELDDAAGTVTIKDDTGQVDIIVIPGSGQSLSYDSQFGSSGTGNGQFDLPFFMALDASGNIYVADRQNDRIQKFTSAGVYDSQFGSTGTGNGQFNNPTGVAIDSFGNIYVSDNGNARIQKFSNLGVYVSQWGSAGSGTGQFNDVYGMDIDISDYIYVCDRGNNRIQKFDGTGSFIAAIGSYGSGNGQFITPTDVSCDTLGNIFVTDLGNDRVQKLTGSGVYVSQFGSSGTGDGQFNIPIGIDVNSSRIFVGDTENRIQMFNISETFISSVGTTGTGDGQFQVPIGIAIDALGDIYVADRDNDRIQKFTLVSGTALPDFSDTGNNDTVIIGDGLDGDVVTMSFANTQYLSTSNTETDYPDIDSGLDVPLDDGTWVDSGVDLDTNTDPTAEEEPLDPTSEVVFPTSARYGNPGENQQNVVLPLPYGNLRENSDGGVWVCPCIDSVNFVYCVAGWPIQSVANGNTVEVYVDGVLQSSGYTFDESNDYESQGDVAIIDFTSDPGGTVTVKCNGKWVGGSLLTDPIDIIEDLLDYTATLTGNNDWQKDPTSFAQARNVSSIAGYTCAGVITSNNTLGFWLKSILKSFLGGFRFSTEGLIEVKLTPLSESQSVQEWIDVYEGISADGTQILDNICGRIIINYANSYTQIDRRFKEGGESSYFRTADKSQTSINPQIWELDFDWCRSSENIDLMQDILLALYADPEYNVNYNGQDFKYVPLSLTDQIQATFPFIRDSSNVIIENIVYSIREQTINLDDFTTGLTLQSVNFASVVSPTLFNVQLGGDNVQLGGTQVTLGA